MKKYNQLYILFLLISIALNMLIISILNRLVPNNLIFFTLIATSTTVSILGIFAMKKIAKSAYSKSTKALEFVGGESVVSFQFYL